MSIKYLFGEEIRLDAICSVNVTLLFGEVDNNYYLKKLRQFTYKSLQLPINLYREATIPLSFLPSHNTHSPYSDLAASEDPIIPCRASPLLLTI
jgi:hypothetical protein